MPYKHISKAQQNCVQRYVAKHYDHIVLTVPKGERDKIKAAASRAGLSANKYILGAVSDRMEKENVPAIRLD